MSKLYYGSSPLLPIIPEDSSKPYSVLVYMQDKYMLLLQDFPVYMGEGLMCGANEGEVGNVDLYTYQNDDWVLSGSDSISSGNTLFPFEDPFKELIWSNTNIPDGAMDAVDIIMYASDPYEKRCYINGVLFPETIISFLGKYSYLYSMKMIAPSLGMSMSQIFMIDSDSDIHVDESSGILYFTDETKQFRMFPNYFPMCFPKDEPTSMPCSTLNEDGLPLFISEGEPSMGIEVTYMLLYSSHDVLGSDSGEVYFESSEPILENSKYQVTIDSVVGIYNEAKRLNGGKPNPILLSEALEIFKNGSGGTTVKNKSLEEAYF